MIVKQFRITGMIMAVIGIAMSALFSITISQSWKIVYPILEMFLKWAQMVS